MKKYTGGNGMICSNNIGSRHQSDKDSVKLLTGIAQSPPQTIRGALQLENGNPAGQD